MSFVIGWILYHIVYPPIATYRNWSDRQQRIYEEYQSSHAKLERMYVACLKLVSKEELAAIDIRIEKQRS